MKTTQSFCDSTPSSAGHWEAWQAGHAGITGQEEDGQLGQLGQRASQTASNCVAEGPTQAMRGAVIRPLQA